MVGRKKGEWGERGRGENVIYGEDLFDSQKMAVKIKPVQRPV